MIVRERGGDLLVRVVEVGLAFLTLDRARSAASGGSADLIQKSLRASAAAAPPNAEFDVFLSHCVQDARAIEGVKLMLEGSGLSVYVDWIDDPSLDRSNVTVRTAAALRQRLQHSKSLIFATSHTSPSSKWMPWELGYFDGHRPSRVAVLPLTAAGGSFQGQEYLRLYPLFEDIGAFLPEISLRMTGGRTQSVREFVRDGAVRVVPART